MTPTLNTRIPNLGPCNYPSPLRLNTTTGDTIGNFVSDEARVRHQVVLGPGEAPNSTVFFEKAGPRQKIFFNPPKTRAAIVTCGGCVRGLTT